MTKMAFWNFRVFSVKTFGGSSIQLPAPTISDSQNEFCSSEILIQRIR